jgi:hypothetical protein
MPGYPETLRWLTDEIRIQLHVSPAALAVAIKRTLNEADQSTIDMVDPAMEARAEKANALCRRWFQFGEILTVEIDAQAETCDAAENK